MKKITLALCFAFIATSLHAQNIITKDGMNIGPKKNFVDGCVKSSAQELVKVKGIEVNIRDYCDCMAENLIPNLTSQELLDASQSKEGLKALVTRDDNLALIAACVDEHGQLGDDFTLGQQKGSAGEIERIAFVKSCKESILQEDSELFTEEKTEKICSCAYDKIVENNLTSKDLEDLDEEDSEAMGLVIISCLTEVLEDTIQEEE